MSRDLSANAPDPGRELLPPRLDHPQWSWRQTIGAIVACLGLASAVAQLEQRLVPGLLDSPSWLAPAIYVGLTFLPVVLILRYVFLVGRCFYLRARWYNRLYELATTTTGELDVQRQLMSEQSILVAEQSETISEQAELIARSTTIVAQLHRASVVEAVYEEGRLVLIAESLSRLRLAAGDRFVVVGVDRLQTVGTFELMRQSERGLHLAPVRIDDGLAWTSIRREGTTGALRHGAWIAILRPH